MRATDRLRLTLSDKQGTSDTPEEPKLHTELIKKNPIQNLLQYYFFAVAGQKLPTHGQIYKELFSPTRRRSQQQMALPSQGPELNITESLQDYTKKEPKSTEQVWKHLHKGTTHLGASVPARSGAVLKGKVLHPPQRPLNLNFELKHNW